MSGPHLSRRFGVPPRRTHGHPTAGGPFGSLELPRWPGATGEPDGQCGDNDPSPVRHTVDSQGTSTVPDACQKRQSTPVIHSQQRIIGMRPRQTTPNPFSQFRGRYLRRAWDSNPRSQFPVTTVFKTNFTAPPAPGPTCPPVLHRPLSSPAVPPMFHSLPPRMVGMVRGPRPLRSRRRRSPQPGAPAEAGGPARGAVLH